MQSRIPMVSLVLMAGMLAACDRAPKPAPTPPAASAPTSPAKGASAAKAEDKQAIADKALAAKVRSALIAAPGLEGHAFDVTARNGRVSLFGTAATEAKRREAEKLAAGVAGVQSVQNEIKIVSGS